MTRSMRFFKTLSFCIRLGLPQPLIWLMETQPGQWELEYRGSDMGYVETMKQAGAQIEKARRNHGVRVQFKMNSGEDINLCVG